MTDISVHVQVDLKCFKIPVPIFNQWASIFKPWASTVWMCYTNLLKSIYQSYRHIRDQINF